VTRHNDNTATTDKGAFQSVRVRQGDFDTAKVVYERLVERQHPLVAVLRHAEVAKVDYLRVAIAYAELCTRSTQDDHDTTKQGGHPG
jgi:hypothetical protein